ncbi:MAG: OFA family MFS transporter [Oscillospiraceae bacterium]|nr:OFA family MFS transporter [Oscillospiraceae bacterium]
MKTVNRYCVLAAGMTIQLCAGIIYMWSVFKEPIAKHLNWDSGSASLTSSVMLAMFVLGIIIGGYAQDKWGPKRITLAGSVLIGAGMALTALIPGDAPWLVYVTYGVIGGFGVGTVYTSTIAAIQKWFPDRRGFASGMVVSAFGLSLVVFAPLARSILGGIGVPGAFLIFGLCFLAICGVSSFYIDNPPEGYSPNASASTNSRIPKQSAGSTLQYSPKEIIKTKQFYLLAGSLLLTLPAYFILNPVFVSLGTERGLSDNIALLGVSLTGVCSAAGRLIVAWASDKIGGKNAMTAIAAIILCAALVMTAGQKVVFLICIMLISFGFGGAASVYSTMTAASFGTKYGGMNFGLVMVGFGVSALVFPIISNKLIAGGSYTGSFILAAATCVAAIVLIALMKNPNMNKSDRPEKA